MMVKIIEYVPNAIVSKTIIKKTTGNITLMSFDSGEELAEKTFPFDTFAQIIEGSAEITINKKVYTLQLGRRNYYTCACIQLYKSISTL